MGNTLKKGMRALLNWTPCLCFMIIILALVCLYMAPGIVNKYRLLEHNINYQILAVTARYIVLGGCK